MDEDRQKLVSEVLRELGWVRRLAEQLARDDADDISQEVAVAALRVRPQLDLPLRPWLASVLRKLVHTRRRATARRLEHETNAAGHEAAPASDVLLEKAEILRLVGELVTALDEPYRSTVLLRFYEGLSSAEIAQRQGVPAGTIRWRLKQAVEQLRQQLDERVTGGRRTWSIALMTSKAANRAILAKGGGSMLSALKVAAMVASVAIAGSAIVRVVGNRKGHPSGAAPSRIVIAGANTPNTQTAGTSSADDDWYSKAQQAYVHGQYADAIDLAEQGKAQSPGKAWRIIGASSCFLQDPQGAAAAWNQLDPTGRKFVEFVCARNKLAIPDGSKVL